MPTRKPTKRKSPPKPTGLQIKFGGHRPLTRKGAMVVLLTDGGKLGEWGKVVDKAAGGALQRAVKTENFKGKAGQSLKLLTPTGTQYDCIIAVGVGAPKKLTPYEWEKIGGVALNAAYGTAKDVTVMVEDAFDGKFELQNIAARIGLGARLGAYRFDRYKSKKSAGAPKAFTLAMKESKKARGIFDELNAVAEGVEFARNLVNEPANVLTPLAFAARTSALTELGVKREVLTVAQMKRLGMGALLGVGQGSANPSRLVVLRWQGARNKSAQPLAFVGKGVCFDTGGISIKPSANMGDMKGDMGGAAAVTGLMHALARRKAKVNAVGVIGLVENMPSGAAQRPGDIVKSMSGQTIEVLNTDAEGRLVLADAIWYTQKRFKPAFIIDLATLTGAIMIALGQEYAGLFSDDDRLAQQLEAVGRDEGEKVWRMPVCDAFDKMINTPNADMQNIGGRFAGSSTAAQFLKRFVNGVPWVHLDIAGTAMGSPKTPTSRTWASGYGVKLLDRFVRSHYE